MLLDFDFVVEEALRIVKNNEKVIAMMGSTRWLV